MQITTENFRLVAAKCYRKRLCVTTKSFLSDMQYLDCLEDINLEKMKDERELRLALNKMTIAFNLFGPDASDLILFRLRGSDKYNIACHLLDVLGLISTKFEYDPLLKDRINEALSKL